jgi:hypothetical protein
MNRLALDGQHATDAMLGLLFLNSLPVPRSFSRNARFSWRRRSNAEKPALGKPFRLPYAGNDSLKLVVPQVIAVSNSPAHHLIQHSVESQLELFGCLVRPRGDLTPNLINSFVPNLR